MRVKNALKQASLAFILAMLCSAELHAQAGKDRRQGGRSLKDQLRQGYNISVAERDEAVTWQSATIGVVALSRSRDYLHGLIEEVERAARRILNEHGAELVDSFWEYLES